MESIGTTNIAEYMLLKKNMDTQIGALNAAIVNQNMQKSGSTRKGLRHLDPETEFKVRRITSRINESIHMVASEPSLGLFRIQEHVYRTLPQLVQRKNELKANVKRIEETTYDLNLSMDVIESISKITHFTRMQTALDTAIEMKRRLNMRHEQEKARFELDAKKARVANKSLSIHEPAEGYICPLCYFALDSQDGLISHWQKEHSLDNYDNEVFHEVEMPLPENYNIATTEFVLKGSDMTVIEIPMPHVSECEDVVKSFTEQPRPISISSELSASDGSSDLAEPLYKDDGT